MEIKAWLRYGLVALALLLLLLLVIRWHQAKPVALQMNCAQLQHSCQFKLGGATYAIRSLQPISTSGFFTIELQGVARAVSGSWQMQSMDMGPNQYRFIAASAQSWRATMALPMCTQARHDWLLKLNIDGHEVEVMTSSVNH